VIEHRRAADCGARLDQEVDGDFALDGVECIAILDRTCVEYRVLKPTADLKPGCVPGVEPPLLMLAALGANGGPGWQNVNGHWEFR